MSQVIGISSNSFLRALSRLLGAVGHLMPKWRPPVQTELPSTMTVVEWADLPTWHPASPED